MTHSRRSGPILVALAIGSAAVFACEPVPPRADALDGAETSKAAGSPSDSLWVPIRHVFGIDGEAREGYFRIDLPRSDLQVRIGRDTLSPDFEFTSYVGFAPNTTSGVFVVGEIILRQDEVAAALAEAKSLGITVTALHNHLIGEDPRIMYMHIWAQGAPDSVAMKLRSVFGRTGTPLPPREAARAAMPDWSGIDAVLGEHSEAEGSVAEYVFPRKESHSIHGIAVKSSGVLETASEVVFQQLEGGRVASTGEIYVLPQEVDPVVSALESHGLNVTAIHNHMIDERPVMYWIHWYATGDGPTLAKGVATALARTNSQQKSIRG